MTDAIDRENSNRWDNDEEGPLLGGENNVLMAQLRIDGQVFYSSANVTFDVATTKKVRGYQNRFSGNRLECMSLCNTSGLSEMITDYTDYSRQFQQGQCVDRVSLMVVVVLQVGVQTQMVKTD